MPSSLDVPTVLTAHHHSTPTVAPAHFSTRTPNSRCRSTLLQRDGALVNITGDESVLRATEGPLADFLSALPSLPGQRADWNQTLDPASEALVVPTQV